MRVRWAVGFVLLASLALFATADQTTAVHPDRLGLEIQVSPMSSPEQMRGHFIVTTLVRELETGKVVFAPKVATLPGVVAKVSSDKDASSQWKASYVIDGTSAKYTIEGTKNGEAIFSSTGTIQLTPPALTASGR